MLFRTAQEMKKGRVDYYYRNIKQCYFYDMKICLQRRTFVLHVGMSHSCKNEILKIYGDFETHHLTMPLRARDGQRCKENGRPSRHVSVELACREDAKKAGR